MSTGEIVIHLDPFRERISRLQHVDVVVGCVGLQDRLQYPIRVVPLLPRDMQRAWHNVYQQSCVVRRTHDLDGQILQRGLGQIGSGRECITERPPCRIHVGSGAKGRSIRRGEVGRTKRVVVKERPYIFHRLIHGERIRLGPSRRHFLVEVIPQFLESDDVTQGIRNVGSGTLYTGAAVMGTGVAAGTRILGQISGTTGGVGVYQVSVSQTFASGTITTGPHDFSIDNCEFRDTSSVLNALTIFTGSAAVNNCSGFSFTRNRVSSLGTTAATTALVVSTDLDRVLIANNLGTSAVLNDTAAVLAAGTGQLTNFYLLGNQWERPNTSSTGGSFVSGSGNAWTGLAADNYFYQADTTAGIWIATGHGSAFGYQNNYSPITYAANVSGLINPAAA